MSTTYRRRLSLVGAWAGAASLTYLVRFGRLPDHWRGSLLAYLMIGAGVVFAAVTLCRGDQSLARAVGGIAVGTLAVAVLFALARVTFPRSVIFFGFLVAVSVVVLLDRAIRPARPSAP